MSKTVDCVYVYVARIEAKECVGGRWAVAGGVVGGSSFSSVSFRLNDGIETVHHQLYYFIRAPDRQIIWGIRSNTCIYWVLNFEKMRINSLKWHNEREGETAWAWVRRVRVAKTKWRTTKNQFYMEMFSVIVCKICN